MAYLALVGRILMALIFLSAVPGHFSAQTIAYAAGQGVPLASVMVPLSGILALLGGLSFLLGYKTRIGAILLAVFLIPVTLMMHKFWALPDPQAQMIQQIMFMKNLAILGGMFLVIYLNPVFSLSLDSWCKNHPCCQKNA